MNRFFHRAITLISLAIFACTAHLQAQELKNIKTSQLSDQQMMQIWQQFSSKGMSESEAMKMIKQTWNY